MCLFKNVILLSNTSQRKNILCQPKKKAGRMFMKHPKRLSDDCYGLYSFFYFNKVFRFFVLKKYWHVPKDIYNFNFVLFLVFGYMKWSGAISFILLCLFYVIKQIFEQFLLEGFFFRLFSTFYLFF